MRAPSFWWRQHPTPVARLLSPAGALVGRVAARRMRRSAIAEAAVPGICIGNPTVGGAGKTPVAIAVAQALREAGASPVFLTRGYRGSLKGPLVVAGHAAGEVGDEALLLAGVAATVVARDRAAGGLLAATLGDVIVMDDGFQNPALAKTFSALLVDVAVGLGNGLVTPAGPLRAPLAPQLALADRVVLVGGQEGHVARLPSFAPVPSRSALLRPTAPPLDGPLIAFAGIGRPDKFFASVRFLSGRIVAARPFSDHHAYTDSEARALLAEADRGGARPVTTRKDMVRLRGSPALEALAARSLVVDIAAVLDARMIEDVREVFARPVLPARGEARS